MRTTQAGCSPVNVSVGTSGALTSAAVTNTLIKFNLRGAGVGRSFSYSVRFLSSIEGNQVNHLKIGRTKHLT